MRRHHHSSCLAFCITITFAVAAQLHGVDSGAGQVKRASAVPVVSNVRAMQRPAGKVVDVFYDLHDADGDMARVDLMMSDNGGQTFRVLETGCTGDWGTDVPPGVDRHIEWDAGVDWDAHCTTQAVFRVVADDAESHTNAYILIDLSPGAQASHYPVQSWTGTPRRLNQTFPVGTTMLALVRLSAGSVQMGSPVDEEGRYGDEDERAVQLSRGFSVGVFEVTQEQWFRVMGTEAGACAAATNPVESVDWDSVRGGYWPENDRAAATSSFVGRLRQRAGLDVDLPTEAQWEYACRAGQSGPLNSGAPLRTWNLARIGRFSGNWPSGNAPTHVGGYAPNAWGLYDMHGNVAEWCLDRHTPTPTDLPATDPVGPESGNARLLRGGSRLDIGRDCRSAVRKYALPHGRSSGWGFRIVINE